MAPSEQAMTKLLFRDADKRDLTKLGEYEKVGGYKSLKKALRMKREAVLDELLAADVRGTQSRAAGRRRAREPARARPVAFETREDRDGPKRGRPSREIQLSAGR